jgi:hypothetical protein
MRYEYGGLPLLGNKPVPDSCRPPPCPLCGAPRQFEFQLLSRVLDELGECQSGSAADSTMGSTLDSRKVIEQQLLLLPEWLSVAVFVCDSACPAGAHFGREWIHVDLEP